MVYFKVDLCIQPMSFYFTKQVFQLKCIWDVPIAQTQVHNLSHHLISSEFCLEIYSSPSPPHSTACPLLCIECLQPLGILCWNSKPQCDGVWKGGTSGRCSYKKQLLHNWCPRTPAFTLCSLPGDGMMERLSSRSQEIGSHQTPDLPVPWS